MDKLMHQNETCYFYMSSVIITPTHVRIVSTISVRDPSWHFMVNCINKTEILSHNI